MTSRTEDAPPQVDALSAEERALLERFRSGERQVLQSLLRRHVSALLVMARRCCNDPNRADDLVQETLLAACRGLDGFRGEATLRTWLLRILLRLATAPARFGFQATKTQQLDSVTIPDTCEIDPQHASLDRELRERIDEAMERLPARQRTALHLRAVEGMGYATIADLLDCSAGATRMLVLSARRRIRERLASYLEESP